MLMNITNLVNYNFSGKIFFLPNTKLDRSVYVQFPSDWLFLVYPYIKGIALWGPDLCRSFLLDFPPGVYPLPPLSLYHLTIQRATQEHQRLADAPRAYLSAFQISLSLSLSLNRYMQKVSSHVIWKIKTLIEEDTRHKKHCT